VISRVYNALVSSPFESYLQTELAALRELERLREPDDGRLRAAADGAAASLGLPVIDASSNDYLGFAEGVVSRETAVQVSSAPTGAGASRLIHGTRDPHLKLESELAAWVRLPAALLFSSGFAANTGLLSALATRDTVVFSDALNHASIIDGCRQARARTEVIPHLNLEALDRALSAHRSAKARFVVVESFFSMDGDVADLRQLRALCDAHSAALLVDEAHALGVFGPHGAGRCAEAGVVPDALMGTLGKSVGAHGAFVAGSGALRTLLWNRARSFVFSTAGSPTLAELARFHVQHTRAADVERQQLHAHVARLRDALADRDLHPVPGSVGPIVPLVVGSNTRAVAISAALAARGILTQAIRPPTVPEGTARIRLTVKASWPADAAERIAAALAELMAAENHA
jgi:8-amino-7-oxononanoate synthase